MVILPGQGPQILAQQTADLWSNKYDPDQANRQWIWITAAGEADPARVKSLSDKSMHATTARRELDHPA